MLIINVHDVRKEIHFVRRNYRFQTNRATIAHWSKKIWAKIMSLWRC